MDDSGSPLSDIDISIDPEVVIVSCYAEPAENPPIRPCWTREGIFNSLAFSLCTTTGLKLSSRTRLARQTHVQLSAEAGTALNPFRSLPYIGMYGKVPRSFFPSFLFYIGHGVAAICQFVEIRTPR
jgi:hypothetical protein